jgi:hypothetical protein
LSRCQPRRTRSTGNRTSKENVVRVCERISGSIGRNELLVKDNFPVNAARPSTADIPQRNVAAAINK